MANPLKMAKVHSIQTLHARGWSQRRIARELGIHRETVARYVQFAEGGPRDGPEGDDRAGQNRPNPPTGSDDQNQPNPPAGSVGPEIAAGNLPGEQNRPNLPTGFSGPASLCEPFRAVIIAALERGLSSQRIWQDLKTEHGFNGGYDSVKRFCRRLKRATPLPFRRMECEPGAEAQVDFGIAAPVITPEGKQHQFVVPVVLARPLPTRPRPHPRLPRGRVVVQRAALAERPHRRPHAHTAHADRCDSGDQAHEQGRKGAPLASPDQRAERGQNFQDPDQHGYDAEPRSTRHASGHTTRRFKHRLALPTLVRTPNDEEAIPVCMPRGSPYVRTATLRAHDLLARGHRCSFNRAAPAEPPGSGGPRTLVRNGASRRARPA